MYSLDQSIEFEEIANPHSWFLVASELHEQAKLLRDSQTSKISLRNLSDSISRNWNSSNRTVILLAGFALENIIKAYLIYEHPDYIRNGFLSNNIKMHKLTKLAKNSTLLPYQSQDSNTLKYFEEGLESWARYPCGLNWAQTKERNILSVKLGKIIFGSCALMNHALKNWRSKDGVDLINLTVLLKFPVHGCDNESLTSGSNRSLRSLGRAKARPFTKTLKVLINEPLLCRDG